MRRLLALLVVFAACFVASGNAAAHVLITDTTGKTGAVLHISPDDDPIAGETANIFFDIQGDKVSAATHSYKLSVTDSKGKSTQAPIDVATNTVSANYIFPSQGVYDIELVLHPRQPEGKTLRFEQVQRVSRGAVAANSPQTAPHDWAIFGIVFSVAILCCLGIVGFNNREAIAAHSRQ